MTRLRPAFTGLVLGLGLGMVYAWLISPVQFTNTAPAMLGQRYRDEYVQYVALAFVVDLDVERARARLAALDEPDPARLVAAFAQRAAASGADVQAVQSLAALASALGAGPVTPASGPSESTPPPDGVGPALTSTSPATSLAHTPTPFPIGAYAFIGRQAVCDANLTGPLIQAMVMDASGAQVPGIEVVVEWDGGFDHFFTGLKPELGNGYGDFTMTAGVSYNVHLVASPSAAVSDMAVESCTDLAGRQFPGSWLLVFREQ